MRPDALPVRPIGSRAVLSPAAVAALFGAGAALRGTKRVQLVRLGRVVADLRAEAGGALALYLDALDRDRLPAPDGLRVQGPAGAVAAPPPLPVRSRLVLPDGLRRAWAVAGTVTLGLGPVAVTVPVESGAVAGALVERALWLGAGQPESARWLPGVDLALPEAPEPDARVLVVERRVVTENDVRQARLKRKRIRLGPGQVVTPAARSLGREWNVFEEDARP